MTEIRVPTLGESVTEATIGRWFKKAGDPVAVDEPLVELETDKVTIEVPAPSAGTLERNRRQGRRDRRGRRAARPDQGWRGGPPPGPPPRPRRRLPGQPPGRLHRRAPLRAAAKAPPADAPLAPSVRKLSAESGIDASTVPGSGKDGRVTKGDMLAAIEKAASAPTPVNQPAASVQVRAPTPADDAAREERVKMTRLRQTIARRLEGSAEHGGDADDLQRGRHEPHHGDAGAIQGRVREEARLQARLHGLLHQGRACRR